MRTPEDVDRTRSHAAVRQSKSAHIQRRRPPRRVVAAMAGAVTRVRGAPRTGARPTVMGRRPARPQATQPPDTLPDLRASALRDFLRRLYAARAALIRSACPPHGQRKALLLMGHPAASPSAGVMQETARRDKCGCTPPLGLPGTSSPPHPPPSPLCSMALKNSLRQHPRALLKLASTTNQPTNTTRGGSGGGSCAPPLGIHPTKPSPLPSPTGSTRAAPSRRGCSGGTRRRGRPSGPARCRRRSAGSRRGSAPSPPPGCRLCS